MKFLRHPIPAISPTKRLLIFVSGLVLTFVILYAIKLLNVPLENAVAGWGILSLEASGSVERSKAIIESWSGSALSNAQSCVLLDFLFAVCYSTTLTIA